jgi:hypothetical protein
MESEELQPEDSPWITVCPYPVENIKLLESFDCPNGTTPCKEYGITPSLTIDKLADLTKIGISLQSYMDSVGKPLYRYGMACKSKFQQTRTKAGLTCNTDRNDPDSFNVSGEIWIIELIQSMIHTLHHEVRRGTLMISRGSLLARLIFIIMPTGAGVYELHKASLAKLQV